jgi:hypothetical protein
MPHFMLFFILVVLGSTAVVMVQTNENAKRLFDDLMVSIGRFPHDAFWEIYVNLFKMFSSTDGLQSASEAGAQPQRAGGGPAPTTALPNHRRGWVFSKIA